MARAAAALPACPSRIRTGGAPVGCRALASIATVCTFPLRPVLPGPRLSGMDRQAVAQRPRICVLAPTPLLMVEIEPGDDDDAGEAAADLHLHPGGQGLWVA